MRKFWSKSCTLALALIMLCSTFAGVPLQLVTAADDAATIINIDDNISVNGNAVSQDGAVVALSNDTPVSLTELATDGEYFTAIQNNGSAWKSRMHFFSPDIPSDKMTVFETKFKVEATDASKALPKAQITMYAFGQVIDNNQALSYDEWHTFTMTVDPETKIATANLDGAKVASDSIDSAKYTDPFVNTGFGWQACPNGGNTWDANINEGTVPLDQPIKWTFDYFRVSQPDEGGAATPPPGETEVTETLLDMDKAMTLSGGIYVDEGSYRIFDNYYAGGAAGRDPGHANGLMDASGAVVEDTDTPSEYYYMTQSLESKWQHQLIFENPSSIDLDGKVTIETKFKVKATDYNQGTRLQMMFNWRPEGGNYFCEMQNTIPLSAATEDDLYTVQAVIDPEAKQIQIYFDGNLERTYAYTQDVTTLETFYFYPVAITAGSTGQSDGAALNNEVTWMFDSFKITKTTKGSGTEPEIERTELFSLDENIMMHDNKSNIIKEDGATNALWIEDYSSAGYMETPVISGDQSQLSLRQVKTSGWNSRLNIRDLYGNWYSPATDMHLEAEVRVKVTAAETEAPPSVELQFEGRNALSNGGLISSGPLELSTAENEVWYTIRYDIDPESGLATCYINDAEQGTVGISITGDTYAAIALRPVVQNPQESGQDGTDLATPVTWTFDSIKLNEITVNEPSEPEITRDELFSLDENIAIHNNQSNIIKEEGATYSIWLDDYSANKGIIGSSSISDDKSQLVLNQVKTSAWGMHLYIKDLFGKFFTPSSDTYLEAEVRVKVGPTDPGYNGAMPTVKLQFVGQDVISGNVVSTDALTLSTATEENWHTIRYVIDPKGVATCYVDDVEQGRSGISITGDTYTRLGLNPVVQNTENGNTDSETLNVPVTWTFDTIKLYEVTNVEPIEPTPTPAPVVLPTEKPIPEHLQDIVTRTYPDGKMKAAVMSYDDAAQWMWEDKDDNGDALHSEEKFLAILNEHNVKATFNSVTGLVSGRGYDASWYVDKYLENAKGEPTGHEIASHSVDHKYWDEVSQMDDPRAYLKQQMEDSKAFIEEATGAGSCRGYVFPGSFPDTKPYEDLLYNAGYAYYRGMGTRPASDPFTVPENFYGWQSTMWFGGSDAQYATLQEYMQKFEAAEPTDDFIVFFMWGHSHDFGKGIAGYTDPKNPGNTEYKTAESQEKALERLDEWCLFLEGNSDTIWNPTCLEFVDYVNAVRQLDVIDDGDGNIEVSNPSDRITCYVRIEDTVYDVAPGETISVTPSTPLPVVPMLEEPVSSGAWESPLYQPDPSKDERKDDSVLLTGKTVDLGDVYRINKVEIDHDSEKIMSFSIMTSQDGVNYTPVTDVYAGGIDKYSGKQVYRFTRTPARYVKYHVVLMGDYETQGKLTNMTVSCVQTDTLDISALPGQVNPVDTEEVVLRATAAEGGASYVMNPEGVTWSLEGAAPEGVSLSGNVLQLDKDAQAGTVTVVATDETSFNEVTAKKTITIAPEVAVRDFALYADQEGTTPLTTAAAGTTVYAKATLVAGASVANPEVSLILGTYEQEAGTAGSETLVEMAAPVKGTATADGAAVTAALQLPADFDAATDWIGAYVWDLDNVEPLTGMLTYGTAAGLNAQRLYLDKADTFQLAAMSGTGVTWETSDAEVAAVDASGLVTGTGEGTAVITAKSGGTVIGTAEVQVQPSLYVYLLLGQSNMTGTNTPSLEGASVPISEGVMLLNQYGEFEPAQHKYSRYSGITWEGWYHDGVKPDGSYPGVNADGGGINMGYSFAETFVAEHTDTEIGLVVNSQSGCSIGVYEKYPQNNDCNGYVNTLERARQATSGRGELKGILWMQGESNQSDETYPARFRNLMYDFRRELGDLELPVIAGGLLEEEALGTNPPAHNARMRTELNNIANYGFSSSTEPTKLESRRASGAYLGDDADDVHISARGQIEFGHRFYQEYQDILAGMKR